MDAKDGRAYYYLGDAYQAGGDKDAAIPAYQQATSLLPDSPAVQTKLGLPLQRTTDVEGAAKAFRKGNRADAE